MDRISGESGVGPRLDALYRLTRTANGLSRSRDAVVDACALVAQVAGASDCYVVRAGDPDFVRVGCPCAPSDYEIKQTGYWLVWRELAANPRVAVGAFDVTDRLVGGGRALKPGQSCTHVAAILQGDESNSELLILRGPWLEGLDESRVQFLVVARTILANLISEVLDSERGTRQKQQLESLANVSRAFTEARETDQVLTNIATALAKASGFAWTTLVTYNEACDDVTDRAMNQARYSDTRTASRFKGTRPATTPSELRLGVELARTGDRILVPDVFEPNLADRRDVALMRDDIAGLQRYWRRAHVLSMALFPIVFQERALGFATFSSTTLCQFDDAQVEFLAALVAQAATAIKGLQLYRDLQRSREELSESEERFRSLVHNASDLITVIDADTTIRYQSPSIRRVLGVDADEVVGRKLVDLLHIDDVARMLAVLNGAMSDAEAVVTTEARMRHQNQSWRDIELIGTDRRHETVRGLVLNMRDVTERKALEKQLRHQALHDPLTKLANRTRFADRLEHALLRASRMGRKVAVLFMDLDNFKAVNDSLGHGAGDKLLTEVAERVAACLRPGDTVARLGGDEFALLLEDVESLDSPVSVTERVFRSLDEPFELEGKEILVRASVGIAVSDDGGENCDADALLRNADVAMYVAKSHGKGCFEVFEPSMQVSLMERLELLAELQHAVDRGELALQFQPIFLIESGDLYGFEALVRWRHPRRGVLPPAEFIGLAEESGAILTMGRWVLQEACRHAQTWRAKFSDDRRWTMSVNVSVKQLQYAGFRDEVEDAIRQSGMEPDRLILEITESVMMQDVPSMMDRLCALKELGVRLAIDDFGTGYSASN